MAGFSLHVLQPLLLHLLQQFGEGSEAGAISWIGVPGTAYPADEGLQVWLHASYVPDVQFIGQQVSHAVHVRGLAARVSVQEQFRRCPGIGVRDWRVLVDLSGAVPLGETKVNDGRLRPVAVHLNADVVVLNVVM